ncbi:MAG TPA: hypothetical protein VI670_04660 [Thermoanaerobaculia bacterium]|jgi:hypothetical protein
MATVLVNDLVVEPKATPPRAAAPSPDQSPTPKHMPELERGLETMRRRQHERALRLWAY